MNAASMKPGTRQTFDRIPDEILEEVFLEDVFMDRDLCAIALVNRRFSRLIQASLYSQVEYSWPTGKSTCFKRTLLKCPQLASFVWKAEFREFRNEEYHWYAFYHEIRQLLKMLPVLRVLHLPKHFVCSDNLTCLFDDPMSHLRYLSFFNDARSKTIHEVTRTFSFPQIKRL
jgi:hypothetical protein